MIARNNASQKSLTNEKKKEKKMIIITLETYLPAGPLKKRFFHHCH